MAESLELWQRLGHASYRDWVLAAEKARRVAKAANKAAAKATALVQPSPTSALQPVPLPTLAPPPLHRLPYREELVATLDPSDADKPPEDRRLPKVVVRINWCVPSAVGLQTWSRAVHGHHRLQRERRGSGARGGSGSHRGGGNRGGDGGGGGGVGFRLSSGGQR